MYKEIKESIFPPAVTLLAGSGCPSQEAWEPFSSQAVNFLDAFSRALRQDSRAKQDPETMALAFWCRRPHILSLGERHGRIPERSCSRLSLGRGRIFHLAPANVPMMFAYTWIIGLLAGNAGIVRISERTLQQEPVQAVLEVLREMFSRDSFADICDRTSFISYDRSDVVTEEILRHCDGRILWGGDETIRRMRRIPMPAHAVEIAFPDRVSLAVIGEGALEKMEEEELRSLVHRFYNDTYIMDQNGCSSPQTVVWLRKAEAYTPENTPAPAPSSFPSSEPSSAPSAAPSSEPLSAPDRDVREKWWTLLAEEAEGSYEMDGFRAARKLEKAALSVMRPLSAGDLSAGDISPKKHSTEEYSSEDISSDNSFTEDKSAEDDSAEEKGAEGRDGRGKTPACCVSEIRRYCGNALYVLRLSCLPEDLSFCRGGFGLFYEAEADSLEEVFGSFGPRTQTVVCIGIEPDRLAEQAVKCRSHGVLRFVEPGQALQIDTIWDGIDLIEALSRWIR